MNTHETESKCKICGNMHKPDCDGSGRTSAPAEEKPQSFSDFIRSPHTPEKEKIMMDVIKEANQEQKDLMKKTQEITKDNWEEHYPIPDEREKDILDTNQALKWKLPSLPAEQTSEWETKRMISEIGGIICQCGNPINIDRINNFWLGKLALKEKQTTASAQREALKKVGEDSLEALAELEHEQWVGWSKNLFITEKLSQERIKRWQRLWCVYGELSEEEKEADRKYARKVLQILTNFNPKE